MLLRSRFSRIVRKAIDPVLLPKGFTRRGQTYMRPRERIWWVFNVGRSIWNTAEECRFYICGGILVSEVLDTIYFHFPPLALEKASTGDCIIHYNPETESGTWWTIRQGEDADAVDARIIEEIQRYIETKMMKFYDRFKCLEDVIESLVYLKDNVTKIPRAILYVHPNSLFIPLYLSALYWLKGEQEKACAYLEEAFLSFQHEWWQEHLSRLRERLGCG